MKPGNLEQSIPFGFVYKRNDFIENSLKVQLESSGFW